MQSSGHSISGGGRRELALAAVAIFIGTLAVADAAEPKSGKPAGQPVTVTAEMTGAGIVSSGAVLPAIPPVSGTREKPVPSWGKPLPYPIVIADRRNNRLIEIAPDKRIVWEFPSPNLKIYRGNDDVFFSPDGRRLVVNEEDNYDIHIVDYDTRSIAWSYGVADTKGSGPGYLNYPDDAHLLSDGKIVTAASSSSIRKPLPSSVNGAAKAYASTLRRARLPIPTARRRSTTAISWSRRSPARGSRGSRATARSSGAGRRRTSGIRPMPFRPATARSSSPISRSPAAS
jgi:hypothetical protein